LNIVDFANVLAQTADADAVAAVAPQVLNDDVGAVGFERDTIIAIIDVGVLDDDVVGAVRIPSIV
jgi:hypothetical protein